MPATKLDNHYLADKVALRSDHLPDGDVRVLDCFGGKGIVWACVRRQTGRQIERISIDTRLDIAAFHLHGDNRGFLEQLDLSGFTVVDLDAYGLPIDQIATLIKRGYRGRVFATVIQSARGGVHFGMMRDLGFCDEVVSKCRSVFARRGHALFCDWLALHGVSRLVTRQKKTNGFHKVYCMFDLNDAAWSGAD